MHFIAIDTESWENGTKMPGEEPPRYPIRNHTGEIGRMMAWLKSDLESANNDRQSHPWIVIFGHKIRFTGGSEFMDALEQLSNLYDVDIFFGGHLHYYARYYPMCGMVADTASSAAGSNGTIIVDPGWIIQIVSAAVGSAEDLTQAIAHPNGTASYRIDYGIGVLEALNSTHLHWTQSPLPGGKPGGKPREVRLSGSSFSRRIP